MLCVPVAVRESRIARRKAAPTAECERALARAHARAWNLISARAETIYETEGEREREREGQREKRAKVRNVYTDTHDTRDVTVHVRGVTLCTHLPDPGVRGHVHSLGTRRTRGRVVRAEP